MNFDYLTLRSARELVYSGHLVRIIDPHGHADAHNPNIIRHLCYFEADPQPRLEYVQMNPINDTIDFYQETPE